jgi:putative ABC transport system permease protein
VTRIYRLLVRLTHRGAPARQRDAMLATFASVLRAARQRGPLAVLRTAFVEYLDVLISAGHGDPLGRAAMPAGSGSVLKGVDVFPSLQDWRNAARRSVANPGYAATVIVVLALGIAVNTVIFSVADATLFRGAPYPNGARLVEVFNMRPGGRGFTPGLLPATFAEWRAHTEVFERLEGWNYATFTVTGGAEPDQIAGAYTTPGLLSMLGAAPAHGRLFVEGEGEVGRERVAIISDALWRGRFGADPDLASLPLVLNDERFTVVGVMPAHFRFPAAQQQVWLPTGAGQHGNTTLDAVGLIARGVNRPQAQERLDALSKALEAERPQPAGWSVALQPLRGTRMDHTTRRAVQVLVGAVLVVLLIACANVANLFFTQAMARGRELAVRAALGATRWRLVRELLAESLLLGVVGGILGLTLAGWGVRLAIAMAPTTITKFSPNEIRIDGRMLAFTAAIAITTGIVFGILPAWRASRATSGDALKGRTGQAGLAHGRTRAALVVAEVALSIVLLVGAALLVRSFARLQALDPGFQPRGLLSVGLSIPVDRYRGAARQEFLRRLQESVHAIPGVRAVAVGNGVPTAAGSIHFGHLEAEGAAAEKGLSVIPDADASPEYFATTGIPILRGRAFRPDDPASAAVISEGFARRLWPGQDPIGRRFRLDGRGDWRTVVGVAGEVHEDRSLERETSIEMYSPIFAAVPAPAVPVQAPRAPGTLRSYSYAMLIVRADRPLDLVPAVRTAVWAVDPAQPIESTALVENLVAKSLTEDRFATVLMGTFAALALVLATAGLYAVLAQIVAQRRQEIGIRVALGASRRDIVQMVLSRGLVLTAAGIGIGLGGAWAAARALASQLYEVQPHDPVSFTVVPAALALVALLACWFPTRRALAVDPASALRTE